MVRRFLFGSLALAPIAIVSHYVLHRDTLDFVLAALALIPLAWLIGEATEHAAHHTGPGIGGFLNATFGNAPELIIALFAVSEGLFEVVRGSLTGSVVGNLLLVLGFSLLFGGRGRIDRPSSFLSLGLVAFATLLFLIPAIPGLHGRGPRRREATRACRSSRRSSCSSSTSCVTWWSLRRHALMHVVGRVGGDGRVVAAAVAARRSPARPS